MVDYNFSCIDCCIDIMQKSKSASKLWLDMCSTCDDEYFYMYMSGEEDEIDIQLLENLGYLVTTETEDYIKIKMNGYIIDEENNAFFCIKNGHHEDND